MNDEFVIRRMRDAREVQVAIDWAGREGWNPGIHDAGCFFSADPNGFFQGLIGDRVVVVGSAVTYGAEFAFCGLYIVEPGWRGQGYGLQLTRARLEYVADRNAGIDGVIENIPIYERIGYRIAYRNFRYRGTAVAAKPAADNLRRLADLRFSDIEAYDALCFPAARSAFLEGWIQQPDSLSLGWLEGGRLGGYALRRRCLEGYKIGPLFADNLQIAQQLLAGLMHDVAGEPVYLDIPEINPAALQLVREHGMEQVFATGRMYLKGAPDIDYQRIFGITTFELG